MGDFEKGLAPRSQKKVLSRHINIQKERNLDFLDEKDGADEINETDESCRATHPSQRQNRDG